uniref:Uncharacterized protein n=1 Tax=Panagrolaimus sp. JU765 TaxID=591449 RepID=A0AC34Q6L4_9BILA
MTCIDNQIEVEAFLNSTSILYVKQKFVKPRKRIIHFYVLGEWNNFMELNVTTKSNPNQPIYLDKEPIQLTECSFVLDDIDPDDWIKVNLTSDGYPCVARYSNEFLEQHFPRNEYETAEKRLEVINDVFGSNIISIKPQMLEETMTKLNSPACKLNV